MNFLSTVQAHNSQISQSLDELENLIQELDGTDITVATHAMSQINIGSSEEEEEIKNEETEDSSSSYREPDPMLATVQVSDDDLLTQGYGVALIYLSDID